MKTLYNINTEQHSKFYENPYTVDGQPGILPDEIIELEVIQVPYPTTLTEFQKAEPNWVVDEVNMEYRREWIITDLTPEEIEVKRNLEASISDERMPVELVKKLLAEKVEAEAVADEDLIQYAELFPAYRVGKAYEIGEKFYYEGQLYNVVQSHTTQFDWKPESLPALYTPIVPPGQIGEWIQPTGAHDTYGVGAKVTWNGFTWESEVANNSWEPGVYGWVQI